MSEPNWLELARATIRRESVAVGAIAEQLDETFLAVAGVMLNCCGHVLVAGSGNSHATALRFAHMLSCVGTPALFIHPGDAQHGTSGAVTANDVVVLISRGGETDEVNRLGHISKQRGATVIALTEVPASTVGRLSDHVLKVVSDPAADLAGTMSTAGSLCMSVIGDALCQVLFEMRGYTVQQFVQTHPGGAVGKSFAGADSN